MKYGVCGEPGIAAILAEAGYDYIELHVQRDLQTGEDEATFEPQLARLQALAVPSEAANCFVPGSLKITGPDVDPQALKRYATTAFERAERAGVESIVFGSGGARRVPEGFDRGDAWAQLLDFGRVIAPIAAEHGITVVVEPLNRRECNIFNSIGESADYVRQIDHPSLRLLVDAYHWALEKDSYEDLVKAMPLIHHAHIATYESRMAPGLEPCDFSPFAQALKEGGYDGRLSIEGRWTDMGREASGALAELKRAIEGGVGSARKEGSMSRSEAVGLSSERLARVRPAMEKNIGDDRIAGAVALIARRGEVVHQECVGLMDRENAKPMRPDALFRIYSMTKPITCTALMTLYEKGRFQLIDPVAKFIPAFQGLKVYGGGEGADVELVDLQRPVTVRDLLTHTSGMTYHFLEYGPVEEMYRQVGFSPTKPLEGFVADLLQLPLAFQPGTAWRYSVAHDVVAYLIEVLSGQPLDVYLREALFEPLGMVDTGFFVPQGALDRLTAMYGAGGLEEPDMTWSKWFGGAMQGINKLLASPSDSLETKPHNVFRGGHGLVSTAQDYYQFCQMLLNGGELGGAQILSRKTVELMATNHLAPEMLPFEVGGMYLPGYGYGLGFRVAMDPGQCQILSTEGEFGWAGAASTYFWIDPVEELIGVVMSQFQPDLFHPIGLDVRVAAYQAIVD